MGGRSGGAVLSINFATGWLGGSGGHLGLIGVDWGGAVLHASHLSMGGTPGWNNFRPSFIKGYSMEGSLLFSAEKGGD